MKHGSLFAGIGGFGLGLDRAGFKTAWQVEIDDKCNRVLGHHWLGVKRYGDVNDVGKRNLEPVDVVTGGFPCQDLSVAGKREGLAGKRSGLWFQFRRVLEELRPRWCIIENVPGLLSSNGGRDFAVILQGLAEIGYLTAWRVLDAQYHGVAQRRRRVFIVGSFGDGSCAEILFEPESLSWDSAPSRETGQRVATSLTRGSAKSRGVNEPGRRREDDVNLVAYQCHGNNVGPMGTLRSGNAGLTGGVPFIAHTLGSHHGRNDQDSMGAYIPVAHGLSENQRGELMLTPYSRQITTGGGKPGQGYPAVHGAFGVRRLTPTECERLQGFPDGWTAVDGMSDSARYRMLGNAVAVPVAEWIGRRLRDSAGGRPT